MGVLYVLFYMIFYNKADFIEANCLLANINVLFYQMWQQRSVRVCMLYIWLHLRDDLKLQCSADMMLLSS